MLESKNTVRVLTKINNAFPRLISRVDTPEERILPLKLKLLNLKGKHKKKIKECDNIQEQWDNFKSVTYT